MAPTKSQGKQVANSQQQPVEPDRYLGYLNQAPNVVAEVDPNLTGSRYAQPYDYDFRSLYGDFVSKGSSSRPQDEDYDYPRLNPEIVKRYRVKGIKHTRQLIRPVEGDSFSPPFVEDYIKEIMRNSYRQGWKGPEDVDLKTFTEWFEYFMFKTKWMPEDDTLIKKCFSSRCADIMRKDLQSPKRKLKQVHNMQGFQAVKSNDYPNCLSHKDVNQHEYYSAPDPARGEYSESKRAKTEKLVDDQNMHGEDFSDSDSDSYGHDFMMLEEECHRLGYSIDVDALLKEVKKSFDITHPGLVMDRNVQTSGLDKGCEPEVAMPSPDPDSSKIAAPEERGPAIDSQLVHLATRLGRAINDELINQIDMVLPSIVRDVIEEYRQKW